MSEVMSSVLQVLGSLASLAAIPVSVYLYLRSREARLVRVRREIVRILSYQIGEGRDLAMFEVRAVIDSRLREYGLRLGSISTDEIIEEIVTDTITNPMLERDRKGDIARNLRWLHADGALYSLFVKYRVDIAELLKFLSAHHRIDPEDLDQTARLAMPQAAPTGYRRTTLTQSFSTVFALVAVLSTIASYLLSESTFRDALNGLDDQIPLMELLVGTVGSLLAGFVIVVTVRLRRGVRRRWSKERRSTEAMRTEAGPGGESESG